MYEIKAIIRPECLGAVVHALQGVPGIPGLTVSVVRGIGKRTPAAGASEYGETEMAKLETVVAETLLDDVIQTIQAVAGTGRAGDGKVFVMRVVDAVKVGSGARGIAAL